MFGRRLPSRAMYAPLCFSLLFGCQANAPEERALAGKVASIIGGSQAPDQDNVVYLEVYFPETGAGGSCTGALVADRVVLTAKHCVQEAGASGPVAANQVRVIVGPTRRGERYDVAEVVATAGSFRDDGISLATELLGKDIALLTLYEAPGIAPLPLKLSSPEDEVGKPAVAVGYGMTPSSWGGVKMRVDTIVEAVDAKSLEVQNTICQGDSGGPLLNQAGEIIGVVSVGEGEGCAYGAGWYNRIDMYGQMILDAIQKAGSCLDDGTEACDGFDNDCDGEVDEDCLSDGASCQRDADCTSRLCADTSRGKLCSAPCNPVEPGSCAEGFVCLGTPSCEGYCVPGQVGTKQVGEACQASDECASLSCGDGGDGAKRCLSACRGGAGLCLAGEVCSAGDEQCGACVAAESVSGARGQDEACAVDGDCRSGRCLSEGGDSYCVLACETDRDCDDNHHCRDALCVRGPRGGHGAACSVHNDCSTGYFCLENSRGRFCTSVCTDTECGQGFSCREVSNGMACLPDASVVGGPCTSDSECLSGLCDTRLEVCTRTCAAAGECGPGLECVRAPTGAPGLCLAPGLSPPLPEQPGGEADGGSESPVTAEADAGAGTAADAGEPSDGEEPVAMNRGDGGGCSLQGVGGGSPAGLLSALLLGLSLGFTRRRRAS